MKRTIAVTGAVALLVVGTAFVVRAQTTDGIPACADLVDGGGTYQAPTKDALGIPTAAGRLSWTMDLAAASCPDVLYGLTVFLNVPDGDAAPILASASTLGDTISDSLTFRLEVNAHNTRGEVCVVQTTYGGSAPPTGSKNGAAFDADGSGSVLLDRGPDGPAGGDVEPTGDIYCIDVGPNGSGGRSAG